MASGTFTYSEIAVLSYGLECTPALWINHQKNQNRHILNNSGLGSFLWGWGEEGVSQPSEKTEIGNCQKQIIKYTEWD